MPTSASGREPLEQLAEEFAQRYRRGEHPSLTEYVQKHPELAGEIRELFPALVLIEQLGSADGQTTGAPSPTISGSDGWPRQLGEYQVLREVGRGGMGVVYEAVQESLGRRVALKVLPFHGLRDSTYQERFRREARAAARLHHPHIVPVFGLGEHAGIHYFAMQFIEGQGLDVVLQELNGLRGTPRRPLAEGPPPSDKGLQNSLAHGLLTSNFRPGEPANPSGAVEEQPGPAQGTPGAEPAPPAEPSRLAGQKELRSYRGVARVGMQVADALAYAHQQGVLHRDVKPSNLLLDACGAVWVTDFGLAKVEGTEELTGPGDIVGTLRYMAPERFQGHSDPRSDVYSLGVTLYELLTLRPAFDDTNRLRLTERVAREEPVRPRELDPLIPRDLETIVLKAIAKAPADRYPGAGALAEDLRRFLADQPVRARRSSWVERGWRWCRRNSAVASLGAAVAVLVVLVAVVAVSSAARVGQAEKAQEEARQDALDKRWRSARDQARALRLSRKVGQRFAGLRLLTEAAQVAREGHVADAEMVELRNEAIACLAQADLRFERRLPAHPPDDSWLGIDASFRHYAWSDEQGNVHVHRVADGQAVARLDIPGVRTGPVSLRFSPNGKYLFTGYGPDKQGPPNLVWDLDTGKPVLKVPSEQLGWPGLDFSPDSRLLAVGDDRESAVAVYDLATGKRVKSLGRGLFAGPLAFHPSGQQLAVVGPDDHSVQVFDVETGKLVLPYSPVHPADIDHLAWRGDGRLLAVACSDHRIYLLDCQRDQRVAELDGHEGSGIQAVFSHAGDFLVSTAWDQTTRLWDPVTGRELLRTPGHFVALSADDSRLALFHDGALQLWQVAAGRECRTLHPGMISSLTPRPPGSEPRGLDFSPDGRLLVSVGLEGARVWDLAAPVAEAAHWPAGVLDGALYHPDGNSLFTFGKAGLKRWPVRRLSEDRRDKPGDSQASALQFGPPQPVGVRANSVCTRITWDLTGSQLAGIDNSRPQAVVLHPDRPGQEVVLGTHGNATVIALSPDGRWLATGTWKGSGIKVWDTASGQLAWEHPCRHATVTFSPDGQWLVTGELSKECRFWQVGSWQPGHAIELEHFGFRQKLAFTRQGDLLAVFDGKGMKLFRPDSGRQLATLEAPTDNGCWTQCFSRDGGWLAVATGNHTIRLWDLRAIRRQLKEIDLDWDLPDLAPAPPASRPVRVKVLEK